MEGDMPRASPHSKFITHRIAIHIREQDIEYDEVRLHLSRGSEGIRTPGSDLHIVPFHIEKDVESIGYIEIVFNNQDATCLHPVPLLVDGCLTQEPPAEACLFRVYKIERNRIRHHPRYRPSLRGHIIDTISVETI